MRRLILTGILITIIISCYSQPKYITEETILDLKSSELPSIINTFDSILKEVEYVKEKDTARLELYLQIDENGLIKRVPNYDNTPESYSANYNLIRNKSGQIIYIAEYPNSESDDWSLTYKSFYDTGGNLVAFIRTCSFFNGECAETVHEKSEYYYNTKHVLIKKTYEITDENRKPLDFKKCVFNYRYNYKKYLTLNGYLKNYRFEKTTMK